MATAHFAPALFRFLEELALHNEKSWFDANRARYEHDVRGPALRFILDFGPRLAAISPHFRADPRKQGGSLFRIHRNLRFRPDAPPFKTHTGIQFRHDSGRDAHAPGFYLHLEPGSSFIGVGTWHPAPPTLKAIREGIVSDPDGWSAAAHRGTFPRRFELAGDSLVRTPRGFPGDHPLARDLRRKDLIGLSALSEGDVTSPGFLDDFTSRCREGAPLIRWLCLSAGLDF
jgi:uncharacterized protein (TIGR02453 family)